jgi:hypothetical protein
MRSNTLVIVFIAIGPLVIGYLALMTMRYGLLGIPSNVDSGGRHAWGLFFYWATVASLAIYVSWIVYLAARGKKKR